MRWCAAVLVLAGATLAQDPFAPPDGDAFGDRAAPGMRARFAESLALLKTALERDLTDVRALERTAGLLAEEGRETELVGAVRRALEAPALEDGHRAALRGLLGHLLVIQARDTGGFVLVINGGRVIRQGGGADRKLLLEAADHLRAALKVEEHALRTRESLAEALLELQGGEASAELGRVLAEADALRARHPERTWGIHEATAARLRAEAEALEQEAGDHTRATPLRQQALVLDFCDGTIPFEYEPSLYGPVSLLAPRDLVDRDLARSYRKTSGDVDWVRPRYFAAGAAKRVALVRGLAPDTTDGGAAVLLAIVNRYGEDALGREAVESLVRGDHAAARTHLPRLLREAISRALVGLAARMRVAEAGPALVAALPEDTSLVAPLDVALALGRIGHAPAAQPLLDLARDAARDVYFRRRAVDGLAMLAPERVAEVGPDPLLEISVAAARYRAAKAEPDKGRILAGLERPFEAHEAAGYCAELGIRDAIPLLEASLNRDPNQVAAPDLRLALGRLR